MSPSSFLSTNQSAASADILQCILPFGTLREWAVHARVTAEDQDLPHHLLQTLLPQCRNL